MSERETSLPPEAKTATAIGKAVHGVIGVLSELVVVCVCAWLLSIDKFSEDNFWYIVLVVAIGPSVARIKGQPAKAGILTLAAILPFVIKGKTWFG